MNGMNNAWGMGNGWIIGLVILVVVIGLAFKLVSRKKK
jgi:hypothetical protein